MGNINDAPLVNILPQEFWHAPAVIVGNPLGLRALRDAIDAALAAEDCTSQAAVFTADGEGYAVAIIALALSDNDTRNEIPLGYTRDYAVDQRRWPEWLSDAVELCETRAWPKEEKA